MFQERNDGNYGETILSLFAPVCVDVVWFVSKVCFSVLIHTPNLFRRAMDPRKCVRILEANE